MRIYLDACCLNRPFDDQRQDRIRLESEALVAVFGHIDAGEWQWVAADVLRYELRQCPDVRRRETLLDWVSRVDEWLCCGKEEAARARELQRLRFKAMDALHLACAEAMKADAFLSTDDALLSKALGLGRRLHVAVRNPVDWLRERSI